MTFPTLSGHAVTTIILLILLQLVKSEFTPIETVVPQDGITGVFLPATCSESNEQVPNIIYTIVPSTTNEIIVKTNPPNILIAKVENGLLGFDWNLLAAAGADQAGAKILIPDEMFRTLDACCHARIQVEEGFTSIAIMILNTNSTAKGIFNSQSTIPSLDISTGASVKMQSTGGFSRVVASTDGTARLKGDVQTIDASTSAQVVMEGSILADSVVTTGARIEVSQDTCNFVDSNTGAKCVVVQGTTVDVTVGEPYLGDSGLTSCVASSATGSWAGDFGLAFLVALGFSWATTML